MTTWDYFNCESMGPFVASTEPTTTQTTITDEIHSEEMSSEKTLTESEESNEVSNETSTEQSNGPPIETHSNSNEEIWTKDQNQPNPWTQTQVNDWVSPDQTLSHEDKEYLQNLRTVLLMILSLLCITTVSMTVLTFICFNILT